MLLKIFSKKDATLLLHVVKRGADKQEGRIDLSPESEFLQVSCCALPKGKRVVPHRHVECVRTSPRVQESWLVMKGKLKAQYFDIDGALLEETVLEVGDCSVTFNGGHSCERLEEGTVIYEHKLGPYLGIDKDRENLNF